jgi:hypothetical protein
MLTATGRLLQAELVQPKPYQGETRSPFVRVHVLAGVKVLGMRLAEGSPSPDPFVGKDVVVDVDVYATTYRGSPSLGYLASNLRAAPATKA